MTDTVNVLRDAIVSITNQIREQAECSEFNLVQSGSNPDAARIAIGHFYRIANQLSDMLAAPPKTDCELAIQQCEDKALRDQLFARVDRLFDVGAPEAPKAEAERSEAALWSAHDQRQAVLCQPEAPKVEQEPAAWQARMKGMVGHRLGEWSLWMSETKPNGYEAGGFEIRPLYTNPAPASDELLEALKPLARLEVPKRAVGNAGAYSILHSDILRAADLYAKHKGPQS